MNIHKLVMKNTTRSDLQFERVDGIGYRMTKSPNYVGGIHKKLPELLKNKKACINMKNNDSDGPNNFGPQKCGQYSLIFTQ